MDNPDKLATQSKKDKTKHNTTFVGHHYTQTDTNNVNKTSYKQLEVNKTGVLLQTTGGK